MNDVTFWSSFVFLTNAFAAFFYGDLVYTSLFYSLYLTSIFFHTEKNIITFTLDQCVMFSVVFYGAYVFYTNILKYSLVRVSLIISTFLLTLFLFIYGYFTNSYCFDKDEYVGEKYHALLHFISSFGHHLIISRL